MSRDFGEWRHLSHQVRDALVDAAPQGWCRIDLMSRILDTESEFVLTVVLADGRLVPVEVPEEAVKAVRGIREAYYRPEDGTWLAMRCMVDPPDKIQVAYCVELEPRWTKPPQDAAWARDLERYPRGEDGVPPWLRARLEGAPAADTGPVDTSPADEERGPLSLGYEEQQRLWREIARAIALFAPVDWWQVDLTYRAIGSHADMMTRVSRTSDGARVPWDPPPEVTERLALLRRAMYEPGRGAWNRVYLNVDTNPHLKYYCHWRVRPSWGQMPRPGAHLEELRLFPREPEHTPDWLSSRVGEVWPVTIGPAEESEAEVAAALRAAEEAAAELGADPSRYSIGSPVHGAWCLVREGDEWAVFLFCDRMTLERHNFATAREAARYFVGQLYLNRAAFTAELAPDAKRPTQEWPIQPAGGDAGLQIYGGKRIVTLPPGTEMDRYGTPEGNTLYAAGTRWTHRSQPPPVRHRPYHVYRLRRAVRAVVGTTIPWYDQEGGGTAYVLERPVAELLSDNSLEELPKPTTAPMPPAEDQPDQPDPQDQQDP